MDFRQQLATLKTGIEAVMGVYIEGKKKSVSPNDIFLTSALEDVEQVILGGGKRLRGALLYHGYKAAGGTDEQAAMQAAAGMEFIHSYLLIHDDIMDKDSLRHGVETLHTRYENFATRHFPQKDAPHFGNAIAITLGDMVCAWGNDCIFSLDLERTQVQKAIQKVQSVVHRTGIGQIRDMYIEFAGTATEAEIIGMYEDKTAHYSLAGPLQIGLVLGGGNVELEKVFHAYAMPLGIAFQLQDDILGLYGDEAHLGKTIGSDISEGKFTLLIQKTQEALKPEDQKELKRILQLGEKLTPEDIAWVRNQVDATGTKVNMENRIQEYINTAVAALENAPLNSETKEFLVGLADYMNTRTL
jgi:geranylgeranyl diphosphate synthase type I